MIVPARLARPLRSPVDNVIQQLYQQRFCGQRPQGYRVFGIQRPAFGIPGEQCRLAVWFHAPRAPFHPVLVFNPARCRQGLGTRDEPGGGRSRIHTLCIILSLPSEQRLLREMSEGLTNGNLVHSWQSKSNFFHPRCLIF